MKYNISSLLSIKMVFTWVDQWFMCDWLKHPRFKPEQGTLKSLHSDHYKRSSMHKSPTGVLKGRQLAGVCPASLPKPSLYNKAIQHDRLHKIIKKQ